VDALLSVVNAVDADGSPESVEKDLERIRDEFGRIIEQAKNQHKLEAFAQLLVDLKKRGWQLRLNRERLEGLLPERPKSEERASRRKELSGRRLEQLRKPATRQFVKKLENGRVTPNGHRSIIHLMRDGRDLSQALQKARETDNDSNLLSVVQPYLQCVRTNQRCEHTGLLLTDVWRYFRHTWSNPHDSIPGRSMLLLVRDRAVPNHPVIGIGALSSAAAQLGERDRFLKWTPEEFAQRCETEPPSVVTDWIQRTVSDAIEELYKADFLAEGLISTQELAKPSDGVIAALQTEGKRARLAYRELETREKVKKLSTSSELESADYWVAQAQSLLFRSKRAAALAAVLNTKQILFAGLEDKLGSSEFATWIKAAAWRNAFFKLIRIARSKTIGTAMADLTVCGALPPYNELLAGKLMAMLAISPEVIGEYERRYKGMASVIASSMAGRSIYRPAKLTVVGTSSLYGVRPCQYDRLRMPAEVLGGAVGTYLRYKFLDKGGTAGYGTFQFSQKTKEAMKCVTDLDENIPTVNNRFGEGASPKLRAIRDGLTAVGLDANRLLKHGRKKSIYIAPLIHDPVSYLLGLSSEPSYLFDPTLGQQGTVAVSEWWKQRWVCSRLERSGINDRIERHNLVHPVSHGAKLTLPESLNPIPLFDVEP
jgi:hypothetical protein